MKTIAVIGWKNSGKTTLVSNLTNYYSNKGIKVGVVKHAHHNFDIDHEALRTSIGLMSYIALNMLK